MKRPVQYFSDEYLDACKDMSETAIAQFLDDFRKLSLGQASSSKSKLISLKIPQDLLSVFRARCLLEKTPYQTKIKHLMRAFLEAP